MSPYGWIPIAVFLILLLPSYVLYRRGAYRKPAVRWLVRIFLVLVVLYTAWVYLQTTYR